jgi:HK97 gp10 family phage protein
VADFELRFDRTALVALLSNPNGEIGRDLQRRALRIEAAAKRLCPVDTGRLRASITHELGRDGQGMFALVGTNIDYAIYQEFGTRYMAAQPFLRPAIMAGR